MKAGHKVWLHRDSAQVLSKAFCRNRFTSTHHHCRTLQFQWVHRKKHSIQQLLTLDIESNHSGMLHTIAGGYLEVILHL